MPSLVKSQDNIVSKLALLLLFGSFSIVSAQDSLPVALAASTTEASLPSVTTPVCDRYRYTGFWDIDIDNFADLPPECGPPFSINADRDPDHLPVQLIIIFASYLALTIFVGTSILTVRLKRKKTLAPKAIELQLVEKPAFEDGSPKPASILSWMRNPLKKKPSAADGIAVVGDTDMLDAKSPATDSIASFDFGVLQNDMATRQAEMDRLYAAVAAHDQARKSQLNEMDFSKIGQQQQHPPMPRSSMASSTMANSTVRGSQPLPANGLPMRTSMASTISSRPADRRLARVAQTEIPKSPMTPSHYQQQPISMQSQRPTFAEQQQQIGFAPLSPALPSAALPSAGLMSPGMAYPLSPTGQAELPNNMYPASPPAGARRMRFPNQPSHYPLSPTGSTMQGGHYGMMSSTSTVFSPGIMSARTPLPNDMYLASPGPMRQDFSHEVPPTPRLPPPPQQLGLPSRPTSSSSKASKGRKQPPPALNIGSHPQNDDTAPLSASFPGEESTTPTGESNTTSPEDYFSKQQLPASTQATPRARRPPSLNLNGTSRSNASLNSVASSQFGLPSTPAPNRESGSALPTPRAPNFPMAPGNASKPLPLRVAFDNTADTNPLSPGMVKTTILAPRRDAFMRGPRTARTPMTGQIPQTPYSAYMPFTPVTPITPHLVTRKERKQKKKQAGKSLLDESDLVKEESDEDDAYN